MAFGVTPHAQHLPFPPGSLPRRNPSLLHAQGLDPCWPLEVTVGPLKPRGGLTATPPSARSRLWRRVGGKLLPRIRPSPDQGPSEILQTAVCGRRASRCTTREPRKTIARWSMRRSDTWEVGTAPWRRRAWALRGSKKTGPGSSGAYPQEIARSPNRRRHGAQKLLRPLRSRASSP